MSSPFDLRAYFFCHSIQLTCFRLCVLPTQEYAVIVEARNKVQMKMENILLPGTPIRLHHIKTIATGHFTDTASYFNRRLKNTSRVRCGQIVNVFNVGARNYQNLIRIRLV
jgi:hypothetical protein